MTSPRICTRCVMDTSDPDIVFDDNGHCNHCRRFLRGVGELRAGSAERVAELDRALAAVKERGRNKSYDCVLGLSGGLDSSTTALLAKRHGLRPLVVHLDNGWNAEVSV